MGTLCASHRRHELVKENLRARQWIDYCELLFWETTEAPKHHRLLLLLDYPPQLVAKTLLLKRQHNWVTGHRAVKLQETWTGPVIWLAFMVLEEPLQAARGER